MWGIITVSSAEGAAGGFTGDGFSGSLFSFSGDEVGCGDGALADGGAFRRAQTDTISIVAADELAATLLAFSSLFTCQS